MNAKNPKFAIAPKGEFNSFNGGTKFEIRNFDSVCGSFNITSPLTGNKLTCLSQKCHHLDSKNWILRNK